MTIVFVGQRGIPARQGEARLEGRPARLGAANISPQQRRAAPLERASQRREPRVEALAHELANGGHEVTVTCGQPYTPKNLHRLRGVQLRHLFSLNPTISGGWLHTWLELLFVWRRQPQVVQIHGWRFALLAPLAVLASPDSMFVWTVDELPSTGRFRRWAGRRAAHLFDAVVAPTRTMQYRLLQHYGIRADYIPDGYTASEVPPVPLRQLALRRGQYHLLAAQTAREVRLAAQAYKQSRGRKKLVVLQDRRGPFVRVAREFSFLHFAGPQQGRPLDSLIDGAAVVIVAGSEVPPGMLYAAMESAKPIVAVSEPLYQETLGVSAQFVRSGDVDGLRDALNDVVTNEARQKFWGRRARSRAQRYFQWERIAADYLALYLAPYARHIPVDSAVRTKFTLLHS